MELMLWSANHPGDGYSKLKHWSLDINGFGNAKIFASWSRGKSAFDPKVPIVFEAHRGKQGQATKPSLRSNSNEKTMS